MVFCLLIPRVYLETSVFNFVFADDAPDKRDDTIRFFDEILQGKYQAYTSVYVIDEILRASAEKRDKMLRLITDFSIRTIPANEEQERLAAIYVAEGVIPQKYATDALHIATAAVADMTFITSWNFKHIVKRKTIIMTEAINVREGYRRVGIYSPNEVIEDD